MSDFASISAAETAGYIETVTQENDGSYLVVLEKPIVGPTGESGSNLRAYGEGSSQAAAEAVALDALNAQRAFRYAGTSSIPVDDDSFTDNGSRGTTLTEDVS